MRLLGHDLRLTNQAQLTVFLGVVVQLVDQVERRCRRLDQSRDGQGPGESVEDERPDETTASSATSSRPFRRLPWSSNPTVAISVRNRRLVVQNDIATPAMVDGEAVRRLTTVILVSPSRA
jgi:hypothetical protein